MQYCHKNGLLKPQNWHILRFSKDPKARHTYNQNCQGEGLLNKPVLHQEAGDGAALCHHKDGARVQAALHTHLGGGLRQVMMMMMVMMMII